MKATSRIFIGFATALSVAKALRIDADLSIDVAGLQLDADFLLDSKGLLSKPYYLLDNYAPSRFFDGFDFFTDLDPTRGFVQYVNETYARKNGLITDTINNVRIGVDHKNVFNRIGIQGVDTGRPSVRLQSKTRYTHGLFVMSLTHMPWGCGTWPAWWTLGANWPSQGEIDIIENVNADTNNLMSLHTGQNCTLAGEDQTGTLQVSDCFSDGWKNPGCTSKSNSSTSFGKGFNQHGGGTYAMEWTSEHIRVWNWRKGSEPKDLVYGVPDPRRWGRPAANHQGSCDIDTHFREHQIVFDITFCGDWAGNTYGTSSCPQTRGLNGTESCKAYVAQNPSAFQDTYWDINYLHVYKQSPTTSSSTSSSTSLLSSVTPVHTSASANFGQGASTTETKSASATVVVPDPKSSFHRRPISTS